MKYQSTRGGSSGLSFKDVLFTGYAPDGGMYLPEKIPTFSGSDLQELPSMTYIQMVKKICGLYVESEMTQQEIDDVIDEAFKTFSDPQEPIKIQPMKPDITLIELFHGKSQAFQDLSMCCTVEFIKHFMKKKEGSRLTAVVSTAGNTGASALKALDSVPNVDIVVILPKGRVSKVQELQMTTAVGKNGHVVRAAGSSDDCDSMVKAIFCDEKFAKDHCVGTLNSINWCRIMVQIAHHIYAHYQGKSHGSPEKKTVIFLPTGGMANATAGLMAHKMGVPIHMVCAVTNDALTRLVNDGIFSAGDVNVSLAPAINIQVPLYWERFVAVLSGMDTEMVKTYMNDYEMKNKAVTPADILDKLTKFLSVVLVADEDILSTTRRCYDENKGYIVCPQTAVALHAAYNSTEDVNRVVFATASPSKFCGVVRRAGIDCQSPLDELEKKMAKYTDWEAGKDWCQNLRDLITDICEKRSQIRSR